MKKGGQGRAKNASKGKERIEEGTKTRISAGDALTKKAGTIHRVTGMKRCNPVHSLFGYLFVVLQFQKHEA